jgi:hypothetical protein
VDRQPRLQREIIAGGRPGHRPRWHKYVALGTRLARGPADYAPRCPNSSLARRSYPSIYVHLGVEWEG